MYGFPKSIVNAKQMIGARSVSLRNRSSNYHGGSRPALRYMPTYRTEPKKPVNRELCENIMKAVVDETLAEMTSYNAKTAPNFCTKISEEIKSRIKLQNYDRYKLICVVTIGEKFMQSFNNVVKFLWDAERDVYMTYVYDKPNLFAIATLYTIYYD